MMNAKEADMKGRREERTVLDELLDNHDEEDIDKLDLELNKSDNRQRSYGTVVVTTKEVNHSPTYKLNGTNNGNNNGNGTLKRARSESSCSEYRSRSRSCSCEDHSSMASGQNSDAESQCSYQSLGHSPGLKIKIHKHSNSRTVRSLASHSTTERHYESSRARKKESTRHRNYESLLKYFFKDSCYFVMKSNNNENVDISKEEGLWATPMANELKLNSAFKEFRNVLLIFSVKESGKFQGFARLSSQANYDLDPVQWVLPPGMNSCPFGGLFFVDWICRNELSFTQTAHLFNSFNEGKPVKIARDGQEIEPRVGEQLCRLFPADESVQLIPLLKRMKKQTQGRPKKRHTRGPFVEYESGVSQMTRHQERNENRSDHQRDSRYSRLASSNSNLNRVHRTSPSSSRPSHDDRYDRHGNPRVYSRRDPSYSENNYYHRSHYHQSPDHSRNSHHHLSHFRHRRDFGKSSDRRVRSRY